MLLPTKIEKKSFYLLLSAFTISDLFGNWCESLALVEVTKLQIAFAGYFITMKLRPEFIKI